MKRWVKIAILVWIIALPSVLGFVYFMFWKDTYPNYLLFQPKFEFRNNFYGLSLTSFITSLSFVTMNHMKEPELEYIEAYWKIFTLEENYRGKWNLEVFDRWWVQTNNATHIIMGSWSHLWTYVIHKYWVFYKLEPYFTVEVNRTYTLDSESMNNQIIVDVNNQGIIAADDSIIYETRLGVFGYKILNAVPLNVSIQTGHPTETQINFYGADDHTVRHHSVGEQEIVRVVVYANAFGTLELIKDFFQRAKSIVA